MAGEALTPTSYIQHHLKNFTFQVGEGGFWAIHVDTLVTAVCFSLLILFAFWLARPRSTARMPSK